MCVDHFLPIKRDAQRLKVLAFTNLMRTPYLSKKMKSFAFFVVFSLLVSFYEAAIGNFILSFIMWSLVYHVLLMNSIFFQLK